MENSMSHDAHTAFTGKVTAVFAHRFVVETATGKILADLGPKGAEQVSLKESDQVELSGEVKPSELKVRRIAKNGGPSVVIEHKGSKADEHEEPDPGPALQTVKAKGFTVLGIPRRKPKHFEILGRDKAGDFVEFHVELDGALRKTKRIEDTDQKWAKEMT
jgi:hypothetical protein